jgi:alkylation response protein AidB-like acyl-CoA dehydrogenase
MKLVFDAELEGLREEFRKPLAGTTLRSTLDWLQTGASMEQALWARLGELGWVATAIAPEYGGSGIGELMLCLQAEEIGRSLAPIPFVSSVCGYAIGVSAAADANARAALLPAVATGASIGVVMTDDCWREAPRLVQCAESVAYVDGVSGNVPDGAAASVAIARIGAGKETAIVQYDLKNTVRTVADQSLDLLHACASFRFDHSEARVLARGERAATVWREIVDRYALFTAFEQLGAAAAALEMARQHALQRYAFGRPIASFQALKHSFADWFAALELARSNCLFGAAALNSAPESLHEAAAVARISATEAFRRCARGNMQVHGALGVTWDSGCHLYYRRAQALAGHPGALDEWKESLVRTLLARAGTSNVATLTESTHAFDRYTAAG